MSDIEASREAGDRLRAEIERHLGPGRPMPSLRQVALRAEIGPTTISQWWTKGVAPDMATLAKVADVLEIPLSDLVDAYGGRATEPIVTDPDLLPGRVTLDLDQVEAMVNRAAERAVELAVQELRRASRGE